MQLSERAQEAIDSDKKLRQKIGMELGFTDAWVKALGLANKANGPLTTYAALRIIEKETKMPFEEILIDETVTAG